MELIAGLIIGIIVGIFLMCLLQVEKANKVINAKKVEEIMESERSKAITTEKQDINYINGMSRIIYLYKTFYKEELN